jgi:hypothetical protein
MVVNTLSNLIDGGLVNVSFVDVVLVDGDLVADDLSG